MKASEILIRAQTVIAMLDGAGLGSGERTAVLRAACEASANDFGYLVMDGGVSAMDRLRQRSASIRSKTSDASQTSR
jgi:hypothetical protein